MPGAHPDTFLDAKNDFWFLPDLRLDPSADSGWVAVSHQGGTSQERLGPAPCQVRESGLLRESSQGRGLRRHTACAVEEGPP